LTMQGGAGERLWSEKEEGMNIGQLKE